MPTDLFALIADGPAIVAAQQTLTAALSLAHLANDEARTRRATLLNDPALRRWLPGLGYQAHERDGTVSSWTTRDYRLGTVVAALASCLRTTVTPPANELAMWSAVAQHLHAADVAAILREYRLDQPGTPYELVVVVAYAVAQLWVTTVDYPWQPTDDGITRHVPPWPLRTPITDEPPSLVLSDTKGVAVPCHAWIVDSPRADQRSTGGETIFVSMAGSAGLLKMAKAQWTPRSNRTPAHALPTANRATKIAGAVNPRATWFSTGVGSHIHAVYIDERVLRPEMPHFYHITGADGVPDWTLLFDQLNRCLLAPIEYTMIEPLWTAALTAGDGLVVPLHSYGCQGYRIHVADVAAWASLLDGLTGQTTTVTIISDTSRAAAAAEPPVAVAA